MTERSFVKLKNAGNKFIKIKCPDCSNEQVTYTKISSPVTCLICGNTIARPTGGTIETTSEVVEDAL
ncbi:MAG: 30S ribosomal protein S27e [Candidatus Thermoplasmatota archaeon]|nr:30S ribosomal protein S27e [Candidatus Thermoplasmatota archaeon]